MLALALLVAPASATPVNYSGYQVLRALPSSAEDVAFLRDLVGAGGFDAWREPRAPGVPVDIM